MSLLPGFRDAAYRPLLKWPGGKRREWKRLGPLVPNDVRNFIDPFMGGLAPFALTPFTGHAYLNDRHPELVDLHRRAGAHDPAFFAALDALAADWDALGAVAATIESAFVRLVEAARGNGAAPEMIADVVRQALDERFSARFGELLIASLADKARRVARLEVRHDTHFDAEACAVHGETAVRAAYYTLVRERERREEAAERTADFLFVRDFCYGSMFRTNAKGEFNIPYGGTSYNAKSFARRVARLRSDDVVGALSRATFSCGDFAPFLDGLVHQMEHRDFVFLDPPYDSDFSTYGTNVFDVGDHERLADTMARLPARWLLVIKETPDVERIYVDGAPSAAGGRVVLRFGKQYGYNVRGRNARDVRHVVVANY